MYFIPFVTPHTTTELNLQSRASNSLGANRVTRRLYISYLQRQKLMAPTLHARHNGHCRSSRGMHVLHRASMCIPPSHSPLPKDRGRPSERMRRATSMATRRRCLRARCSANAPAPAPCPPIEREEAMMMRIRATEKYIEELFVDLTD